MYYVYLIRSLTDPGKLYIGHNVVLESFAAANQLAHVLRWEITYKDQTTESVITILKYDTQNRIIEINEVFGEKEVYQWHL